MSQTNQPEIEGPFGSPRVNQSTISEVKKQRKPRQVKKRSLVWKHYRSYVNKAGVRKSVCIYCKSKYYSDSKTHGTSNLWSHLKVCPSKPDLKAIKGKGKGAGNVSVKEDVGKELAKSTKKTLRALFQDYIRIHAAPTSPSTPSPLAGSSSIEFTDIEAEDMEEEDIDISVLLVFWTIEKWFFSLSNWVPLGVAVWATIQVNNAGITGADVDGDALRAASKAAGGEQFILGKTWCLREVVGRSRLQQRPQCF
ncbi:OLC1v1000763C1 [Oldenlandia corymbosa var. corymbosa]|uniref:OLC1v1000763C1 n=1 Tax=Oldenlandia corymbosa var. corymbosa TaxID=529605 RepID=A0AAV1D4J4_OLDCO|nr:OLC1v1000763C1 [Oldenlandia corymbosa var. corymbosa]